MPKGKNEANVSKTNTDDKAGNMREKTPENSYAFVSFVFFVVCHLFNLGHIQMKLRKNVKEERMFEKYKKISTTLLICILSCFLLTACGDDDDDDRYKLEVGTSGNGSGTVVSSPTGINCGGDCSSNFDDNTQITLEAMPDKGSEFIGWSGDCSGTGDCALTMSQARNAAATFRIIELEDAISLQALTGHLQNFADIADEQGDRAAGKAGYDASVSYVQNLMAGTNLTVSTQDVAFRLFEESSDPVLEQTLPNQETYAVGQDFLTMSYSGAGDVTAEIAFVTPQIPAGADPNSSDDACDATDFDNADVSGKIAVIQRGTCDFYTKARNAQDNGAVAVLIFNEGQVGRTGYAVGNLGDDSDVTIPVVGLSYASANALYALAQDGAVTLRLAVSTNDAQATASNVFAETPAGNADQVILLGAQLDSAIGSPGINSSGTGSSALLEMAYQIGTQGYAFANRLRFAWWADADSLLGATNYADSLSDADVASLGMYLNADAIGSANYVLGVEDGDLSDTADDMNSITDDPGEFPGGTADIEAAFAGYFGANGHDTVPRVVSGESAYYPRRALRRPVFRRRRSEDRRGGGHVRRHSGRGI